MNNEYERKFLLEYYPAIFSEFKKEHIKQWYISKPTDTISIRVRLYDDGRCYLDLKRGYGMERYEYGCKCSYDDIKDLLYDVACVEKDRFKLHFNNFLLIIDEFQHGLRLVEIESDDLTLIQNFEPFDWMGREVTNDREYTNNWIAYNDNS